MLQHMINIVTWNVHTIVRLLEGYVRLPTNVTNKCWDCTLKHVAKAICLMDEVDYPSHVVRAIGELALGEAESPSEDTRKYIRRCRLQLLETRVLDVGRLEAYIYRRWLDAGDR